jgi:hypothetical protein
MHTVMYFATGVMQSTPPGAQYDDYFVHLYGTLPRNNIPDYNGSQIQVDRIELEG